MCKIVFHLTDSQSRWQNKHRQLIVSQIQSAFLHITVSSIVFIFTLSIVLKASEESTTSPEDEPQRLGIWDFEEGYITHITFRNDLNLVMYLVNPEGAAIWEMNLAGPSKVKTVSSSFLSNLAGSPDWFANTDARFSDSADYLFIWQTSNTIPNPPAILLRFERGELIESIPLDIPLNTQIMSADFSSDDHYLMLACHNGERSSPELLLFDLNKEREFGVLLSSALSFKGNPALVSVVRFVPRTYEFLISTGIYRSSSYSPPLLVLLNLDKQTDNPLIQGSLLPDGLITHDSGFSILLDPRTAVGKTGIEPNNWWYIPINERLARRVCDLKGQFNDVWRLDDTRFAAIFQPRSGSGILGESRFILLKKNEYSTIATGVRLATCSISGLTAAAVMKSSNRLEIFAISSIEE